jgi:hypothetical protein
MILWWGKMRIIYNVLIFSHFERSKPSIVHSHMKSIILFLFIVITLQSFAQTTVSTVTIDPYKSLSYGAFYKSLTIHSDDTHAEYIDGFNFEWGYIYEIELKSIKLKNPPMDGGDTDYELVKEISKTKVADDYRFEMRLENEVYLGGDNASSLEKIDKNTFLYFKEIKIVVPDELLEDFKRVLENGGSKKGTFGFNEDGSLQLYEIK